MLKNLLCLLFISNAMFSQKLVVLDEDSQDVLENVSYKLFLNKKLSFEGKCKNDEATVISEMVVFDSIVFQKEKYKPKGFSKKDLPQVIYLSIQEIFLEEVIINATYKVKDTLLGEKNKFFNKRNRFISDSSDYMLNIKNPFKNEAKIKSFRFFVEKVKTKTAYKINFYSYIPPNDITGEYFINKLIMSSEIQYLNINDKGEINVDLTKYDWMLPEGEIWIGVELVEYIDENNNPIVIEKEQKTKIKFQFSNESNDFEKYSRLFTQKLSTGLFNINARIKHDFAFRFFQKPHRRNLVAPAYFLEIQKPIFKK